MRKFLDPWSVPHFLFGVVVALGALLVKADLFFALLLMLLIALTWEWFEIRARLREHPFNTLADVLLPLVAFLAVVVLVSQGAIGRERLFSLFVVSVLIYAFTNLIAWRARLNRERGFLG